MQVEGRRSKVSPFSKYPLMFINLSRYTSGYMALRDKLNIHKGAFPFLGTVPKTGREASDKVTNAHQQACQ